MRYYISLIGTVIIGLLIFTACQKNAATTVAQSTPPANSENKAKDDLEKIPRISLDEAKKAFDSGDAIFVDTRAEVAYKPEHVKGALNIPAEAFQTRYTEVPKDKKIITYCS